MRESGITLKPPPAAPVRDQGEVNLMRCTRCGHDWDFNVVEQIEIWLCRHCGYEARERSKTAPLFPEEETPIDLDDEFEVADAEAGLKTF